jgi:hypothetical protein
MKEFRLTMMGQSNMVTNPDGSVRHYTSLWEADEAGILHKVSESLRVWPAPLTGRKDHRRPSRRKV